MPIPEKQFEKYLMLYGTSVTDWPDEILAEALRAQHHPALIALTIEQQYFDEVLLNYGGIEPASPNLADRIIATARNINRSPRISVISWLRELLAFVLPQPAFALATVLTLGIVIGFSVPTTAPSTGSDPITQSWFDDEGAAL